MKKKIIIALILVAVLTVLVVPIKSQLKEGGTTMYTALAYRVIVWRALMNEGERKTGTEFHLFPNNFHDYKYYFERSNPTPETTAPSSDAGVLPQKLLDFIGDDNMPWEDTIDLDIPEFPDVKFQWTSEKITANGETIIWGMPVWNVYLADLNDDGMPEICASVSIGSGISDNRIAVYDYISQKSYFLADRMTYDYYLTLEDGKLIAVQTAYPGAPGTGTDTIATGGLAIVDDELVAIGIDRTRSEP